MGSAFGLAVRVGLDGAVAWAVAALLLRRHGERRLVAPLAASLAAGLLIGGGLFFRAHSGGLALGDLLPPLRRVTHLTALALLAGSFALRRVDGAWLLAGWRRPVAEAALLALGLAFLLPQGALLASLLRDTAILRGAIAPVASGALLGAAAATAAGAALRRIWERAGFSLAITPSSLLALLFAIALSGIGPTALGAHTLPAALSGAVGRALHDGVHLAFVTFQVPDHPFLADRAYQLILFAFEPATHAAAAVLLLGVPLVLAARAFVRRPMPDAGPNERAPARRRLRAAFRRESLATTSAFALVLLLLAGAIRAEAARADALYDPLPEPATDDGAGSVIVPLASPLGGGDRMRKFVYSGGGRAVTFFVVRRNDGLLTAALDLCEICQPKGYAQMGPDYVFCKYCKTPIPVGTVGQPGGCNPIPIPGVEVKGSVLLIPRPTLLAAWEKGMAGKR